MTAIPTTLMGVGSGGLDAKDLCARFPHRRVKVRTTDGTLIEGVFRTDSSVRTWIYITTENGDVHFVRIDAIVNIVEAKVPRP